MFNDSLIDLPHLDITMKRVYNSPNCSEAFMATNTVWFTGISLPNITVFSIKGTFARFNGFLWFSFQVGLPNYT